MAKAKAKAEEIREALSALEVDKDEQWTDDGLPCIDIVAELVGKTVTREEITLAAPAFSRTNAITEQPSESIATKAETRADIDAKLDAKNSEIEAVNKEIISLEQRRSALNAEYNAILDERSVKFPPISYSDALKATREATAAEPSEMDRALAVRRAARRPVFQTA